MNAYFFHVFLFLTTNVFTFSVYFFFHVSAHFSRVSSLLLCLFVHCLFFFFLCSLFFPPFSLSLLVSACRINSIECVTLFAPPLRLNKTKKRKQFNNYY